ncbi:MAG: hypothetical protein KDK38_11530 [Leptospiraceae bacterium]|nr:hypothetical protein [Leptospiraceae bacterium]
MLESLLAKLGFLIYTIPAAILLMYSHEFFRNFLFKNLSAIESDQASSWIDPVALAALSFFGVSYSGMCQSGRKDNFITFLASQVFFPCFILLIALYAYLKQPVSGSYLYSFLQSSISQASALFLWNFIPLPPFDASFFFWQRFYNESRLPPLTGTVKIFFLAVMTLLPAGSFWWRGSNIAALLGLP